MRTISALFLIAAIVQSLPSIAQTRANKYEVEILRNPNAGGKDTREVNAILIFEKDGIKVQSRRKSEVFKTFSYANIDRVEHTFSKKPKFSISDGMAVAMTVLTGLPIFLLTRTKEKHWLTIVSDDDFAVLKIENDNYRLIKLEFATKKIEVANINEDKE